MCRCLFMIGYGDQDQDGVDEEDSSVVVQANGDDDRMLECIAISWCGGFRPYSSVDK